MNIQYYHEQSARLIGKTAIWNYIRGGRGVVTLESPSGKHHTYTFHKPRHPEKFDPVTLFVYCLEGPYNYNYVGMVTPQGFKRTISSAYDRNSEQFKGAAYITKMAFHDIETPMKLYHEGVCSCCGRRLTKPSSILAGMGPRCQKYMKDSPDIAVQHRRRRRPVNLYYN